jgi:hypothetical protein
VVGAVRALQQFAVVFQRSSDHLGFSDGLGFFYELARKSLVFADWRSFKNHLQTQYLSNSRGFLALGLTPSLFRI